MMYYTNDKEYIKLIDGSNVVFFNQSDREGYYSKYLEWLEAGNTPELLEEPDFSVIGDNYGFY